MKLNCKPGDMAIVVKSKNGDQIGRIVECIRLDGERVFSDGMTAFAWETAPSLVGESGRSTLCPDHWLRPIRPGEGDDETLIWAGKPEQVAA